MESNEVPTGSERKVLEAMEAAEPTQATTVLARLADDLHAHGIHGVNLAGMWTSFMHLLQRRGYYVTTPGQVAASLKEIEAVGEGFDLFDLARSLAHYDAVRMERRGLAGHRVFPELRPFAPGCSCASRRKPE